MFTGKGVFGTVVSTPGASRKGWLGARQALLALEEVLVSPISQIPER